MTLGGLNDWLPDHNSPELQYIETKWASLYIGLPEPVGNTGQARQTADIDGGYIRDYNNRKTNFEVIVAKSFSETEAPKRLGFVQALDSEPERRLMKMLKNQGLQENQQIAFLSDDADNVRDLQQLMHPEAEHILVSFNDAIDGVEPVRQRRLPYRSRTGHRIA